MKRKELIKMRNKKYFESLVLRHCTRYLLKQYILLDQIVEGKTEVKQTIWKCLNIIGNEEIKI